MNSRTLIPMNSLKFCFAIVVLLISSAMAAEPSKPRALELGAKERLHAATQFSDDGRILASTSSRLKFSTVTFRAWSAKTAAPYAHWSLRTLQQFALSPDGRTVAVITGESQRHGIGIPYAVELRDIFSGKVRRTIIRAGAINSAIYSLAWSRDGRFLATGSGDGLARVWDLWAEKRVATLRAGGYSGALQFSSDEKLLATVGDNEQGSTSVRLWEWSKKKRLGSTWFRTFSPYARLTFSPDHKRLAVSDTSEGRTTLIETKNLRRVRELPAPSDVEVNGRIPVPKVAFSGDGRLMAFASVHDIIVQDAASARVVKRYKLNSSIGPHVLALQFPQENLLRWVTVQYRYQEDEGLEDFGLVAPKIWEARLR